MREALAAKKKYNIPGEIVKVEDVKPDQGTKGVVKKLLKI